MWRAPRLGQPPVIADAYAVTVRAQVAVLTTVNTQITVLEEQVRAHLAGTRTLRCT